MPGREEAIDDKVVSGTTRAKEIVVSAADSISVTDCHHGRCQQRYSLLGPVGNGDDVRLANGQRATRPDHVSAGDQPLAFRGRHEVDLEFNSENAGVHWHETERRVAARAVGD